MANMSELEDLITEHEGSICRIVVVDQNGVEAGAGSGFVTDLGIVTAHHVLPQDSSISLRFEFYGHQPFTLDGSQTRQRVTHESPESGWDYALISRKDLPVPQEHIKLQPGALPPRGREVLYLGFPFGAKELTASVGYVSATNNGEPETIRIDGSVNKGNSGGPLLDVRTGALVGMIVRAETGYLKAQFDQLVAALQANIRLLQQPRGGSIIVGGIDPVDATLAGQTALLHLAQAIERSANVGIGYAFSLKHLTHRI